MIPERIDCLALVATLNSWGWCDYKLEQVCGLRQGYISDLRRHKVKDPRYSHAAAIHNFHERNVPRETTEISDTKSLQPERECLQSVSDAGQRSP